MDFRYHELKNVVYAISVASEFLHIVEVNHVITDRISNDVNVLNDLFEKQKDDLVVTNYEPIVLKKLEVLIDNTLGIIKNNELKTLTVFDEKLEIVSNEINDVSENSIVIGPEKEENVFPNGCKGIYFQTPILATFLNSLTEYKN